MCSPSFLPVAGIEDKLEKLRILGMSAAAAAKLLQSCPTLCDPIDCILQASSVHGILQEEYCSGLPCPPPGDLPDMGIKLTSLTSPALASEFFAISAAAAAAAKSLQSCLTLCDPIDSSPSGSPIPGILQARTLEWVAIAFSNA